MLKNLKAWWRSRSRKPLEEVLVVEFDDAEVWVSILTDLDPEWNQTFRWSNITRVCFKDGGMSSSDVTRSLGTQLDDQSAGLVLGDGHVARVHRLVAGGVHLEGAAGEQPGHWNGGYCSVRLMLLTEPRYRRVTS